jgi:hypothetical protein
MGKRNLRKSHRKRQVLIYHNPIDKLSAPTLASKSLEIQTRETFNILITTTLFPATYAAYRGRVDIDVPTFIRETQTGHHPLIEWGIRALTMWYLAKQHNDTEELAQSRYIYGGVLRYLATLIGDPRWVTSDVTLSAAINLALFEMLDEDEERAGNWIIHSRAIKRLIEIRGPLAHMGGIGRTLLYVFRPFLVLDAFIHQEPCVLDTPEWKAINRRLLLRDERRGRASRLVRILEQAFEHIAACPGLLARVCAVSDGSADAAQRDALLKDLFRIRAILFDLEQQLLFIASSNTTLLTGPGCTAFVPKIVHLSGEGIRSSLALLDQLVTLLTLNNCSPIPRQALLGSVLSGSAAQATFGEDFLDHLSLGMMVRPQISVME